MSEYAYVLSMAFCFLILVTIEFKYSSSLTGTGALGRYMSHKGKYGIPINDQNQFVQNLGEQRRFSQSSSSQPLRCRFSVIIVTYNEPLLSKTFAKVERVMCLESVMFLRIPDQSICTRYICV